MKKTFVLLLIVAFLGAGCASDKQWTQYHSSIDKQTAALLAHSKAQEASKAASRAQMLRHYNDAMVQAAITPSDTDDVLLAFAYGVEMGRPETFSQPNLPKVATPDKTSDLWRAATPFVGMVMPFLYAIPWANNSGSGGDTYAADNGGSISVHSGNPASYNTAGGDMAATPTTTNSPVIDNTECADCGEDGDLGVEGETLPTDFECTTDGYLNTITGKWYTSASQTCSCGSYDAGVCT